MHKNTFYKLNAINKSPNTTTFENYLYTMCSFINLECLLSLALYYESKWSQKPKLDPTDFNVMDKCIRKYSSKCLILCSVEERMHTGLEQHEAEK